MRIKRILWKSKNFMVTSFSVKMMSYQNEIWCNSRFLNWKNILGFPISGKALEIEAILKKKSTKKVQNWTSNSSFILNRPHRIRCWSVFPDYEVGRSFKLIFKITITVNIHTYKTIIEHNFDRNVGHMSISGKLFCIFPMDR